MSRKTRNAVPLVYIEQNHDGNWDVYRCENGFQAWNVIQGVPEQAAREVQAVVCKHMLEQMVSRIISMIVTQTDNIGHSFADEDPEMKTRLVGNYIDDIRQLQERAALVVREKK